MQRIVLIAETDERQRLVALWRAGGSSRTPRVVHDPEEALRLLPDAEVSGMSRASLVAWLKDRSTASPEA
ncbi:hypothetical protein [Acidimangrovimonas sediminis]|uniref:hypothetical protein n=1 Tax=Acidimangrovimonas sediminis TaxID=2056283 RepID=UPI0011AF92F2|nr:hypothetical protein [Acidimangrovimonas sediminis]